MILTEAAMSSFCGARINAGRIKSESEITFQVLSNSTCSSP